MRILYDGSFEGFLTIVYSVYYQKVKPIHIEKYELNSSLFDELERLETNEEKAMRVLEALRSKWSTKNFQTLLTIFMCDSRAFEMDLLQFIILGFRAEKELKNINHPYVFRIRNLEKEYFRYHHRMTGFVRFEELEDGTLYAKIEGKFNILYHLGEHFAKRLNTEKFIIHDLQRALAYVHNEQGRSIQQVAEYEEPIRSANEAKFQQLWKTFFESVAIESRNNPKLQQSFVPLIYRTYMNEFDS